MNNQDNTKVIVERIEKALRSLNYKDADIVLILGRLNMTIQEEIGQEIMAILPQDKQEEINTIIENNGDMSQLATLIPKVSKEEMTAKIEEKLTKAAEIFEQATTDATTAQQKILEYIKSKMLSSPPPITA